jgi:hypothetical protein
MRIFLTEGQKHIFIFSLGRKEASVNKFEDGVKNVIQKSH